MVKTAYCCTGQRHVDDPTRQKAIEVIEVWDKERKGNKLLVLSGEPQLVAPIPCQRVDVGEEGGLLDTQCVKLQTVCKIMHCM